MIRVRLPVYKRGAALLRTFFPVQQTLRTAAPCPLNCLLRLRTAAPVHFNFQIWLRTEALGRFITLANKELQRAAVRAACDQPFPHLRPVGQF